MRRLTASLVVSAFAVAVGVALLSAPTVALSHPGNSCNPPAGHGRTGCHRVSASSPTASASAKAMAARKRAAAARAAAASKKAAAVRAAAASKKAAAARAAAALKKAAAAQAAVQATPAIAATAPASEQPAPAVTALVPVKAPAPVPWWVALWRLLVG